MLEMHFAATQSATEKQDGLRDKMASVTYPARTNFLPQRGETMAHKKKKPKIISQYTFHAENHSFNTGHSNGSICVTHLCNKLIVENVMGVDFIQIHSYHEAVDF